MISRLLGDKLFLLALLAGVLFWVCFYLLVPVAGMLDGQLSLDAFLPQHLLLFVLFYPLVEEAAFRGWLQGALLAYQPTARSAYGLSIANVLTSVLFVLLHCFYHPLLSALAVFFPSLVFGFFRERYGSIKPGIVLHVLYNSGFYVLLVL